MTFLRNCALLAVFGVCASADTITSANPAWQFIAAGANSATWGLPAAIPGCGSEEACEPTGDFIVSSAFTGTTTPSSGYYTITDQDSHDSDYVVFGNSAPGGNGEVLFFSDPNLSTPLGALVNRGSLCTEDANSGCIGSFQLTTATGVTLTIQPASDGEGFFDPFGYNAATSDEIKFTGATPVGATPEPASIVLLFAAFLGAVAFRSRLPRRSAV